MKRNLTLSLMVAAILLLLAACGGGAAQTTGTEPTQAENAEEQISSNEDSASIVEETEAQEESPYYCILLDDDNGTKYDFNYLQTMFAENTLKRDDFFDNTSRRVELVGPLDKVYGSTRFDLLTESKSVDSCILLGRWGTGEYGEYHFGVGGGDCIYIDTSGLEDAIIDWETGDTIRVTGVIYAPLNHTNILYMFQSDGEIAVENLSR